MSNLIAKCGIDCDVCPWGPYPRKSMTSEEFERYRNNAKRILGYMPIKTPCSTCQTPDSKIPKESKLPNRKCLIRQCVDKTGIVNCAYCSRFPCDTMKATAGAWNRDNIEKKLGELISEEDYHAFVEPFEGINRLEDRRSSINPEEILEPFKLPTSKIRIADFPEHLLLSKEETTLFRAIHKLLATIKNSSLGLRDTDTFAQKHTLENLRAHVLRFLWILGRYGKFEKDKSEYIVVDAESYEANRGSEKKLAIWSFVKDTIFKLLSEFGICCERVVLEGMKKEDLTTGTGYLRSKGWVMKMSFEDKIGGMNVLKTLQTYTRKLEEEFSKKAFQHFADADMQILSRKIS